MTSAFGVIRSRPDRPDPSAIAHAGERDRVVGQHRPDDLGARGGRPLPGDDRPELLEHELGGEVVADRRPCGGGSRRAAATSARRAATRRRGRASSARRPERRHGRAPLGRAPPSPASRPRPRSRVPRAPATRPGRTRPSTRARTASSRTTTRRRRGCRSRGAHRLRERRSASLARPARSRVGSPPPFSTRLPAQTPAGPSRPSPSTEVCIRNAGPSASSAAYVTTSFSFDAGRRACLRAGARTRLCRWRDRRRARPSPGRVKPGEGGVQARAERGGAGRLGQDRRSESCGEGRHGSRPWDSSARKIGRPAHGGRARPAG